MGKTWGVIGGFLMGFFVMICVTIIMYMTAMALAPSDDEPVIVIPEPMTSEMPITYEPKIAGGTVALLGFGYLAGWIASIYFGYGFSYDTGYSDCKQEQ
jgi:hypothetical protein